MQDLSDPIVVKEACTRGLRWGLDHAWPEVEVDHYGNVGRVDDNLPPYMQWACGAGELGPWWNDDFEEYMRSVRSSTALTINGFGPLMMAGLGFSIGSHRKLHVDSFEPRTRNGFEDAEEPHMDVIARVADGLVVIAPTCIDYLAPKPPRVMERSEETITSEGVTDAWAAEMRRIQNGTKHLVRKSLAGGTHYEDVSQNRAKGHQC